MNKEQQLIDELKRQPNCQVFWGTDRASIKVAITMPNGVAQISVWLGRPQSQENLQSVLDRVKLLKAANR